MIKNQAVASTVQLHENAGKAYDIKISAQSWIETVNSGLSPVSRRRLSEARVETFLHLIQIGTISQTMDWLIEYRFPATVIEITRISQTHRLILRT